MMGIPPHMPSGSTPPSAGRPSESDKGRPKKEFRLPDKKEKEGKKDEKKDVFEEKKEGKVTGVSEQIKQETKLDDSMRAEESASVSSVETKQEIAKVAQLIQAMVAQMRIGSVEGKEFASLDLKGTPNIPSFLANTTLTLTQSSQGLLIHFSNFETPQQQALAIKAVEQNKEELAQLMLNLQTKNINVAELQMGNYTVALPRIEPLPPPFRTTPVSVQTQTEGQKREQQREEKGDGPEPHK